MDEINGTIELLKDSSNLVIFAVIFIIAVFKLPDMLKSIKEFRKKKNVNDVLLTEKFKVVEDLLNKIINSDVNLNEDLKEIKQALNTIKEDIIVLTTISKLKSE